MARRRRDMGATSRAGHRAEAVRELLAGGLPATVARRHGVTRQTLDRWRDAFLTAGEKALVPSEPEERQRWSGEKRTGRRPLHPQGRTMTASVHVRMTKTLKQRLEAHARRLSRERGEDVSPSAAAREILEEYLNE